MIKLSRKYIFIFVFMCSTAVAATLVFDASSAMYRNLANVDGTNIRTNEYIRLAAITNMIGAYRSLHGAFSLPRGTTIKVVWQDRSSEQFLTTSQYSDVQAVMIPGTQQAASGGGGGVVSSPGNPPFGMNDPFAGCYTNTVKACTSAGGGHKFVRV
ncbi:hypothetical protein [Pseudoxanthomonas kalamensis]|uniref:hypothetical protein n=1 Tax=Pseudoxanthomonas kalamensis TaxID=289483 RepID=UPI00139137F6|nr:hypothetical protein [Pseudoxanthomonas kalamensis]